MIDVSKELVVENIENLYLAIINASPDAIFLTNLKGEIVLANDQVFDIFGYTPDELLGESIEVLVPENLRKKHQDHRSHYHKNPVKREMGAMKNLEAIKKDGTKFLVEISLNSFNVENQRFFSATVRDATEIRKVNLKLTKELKDSKSKNEALEQFAYIASHDLKGPLKNITSLVNLIQYEYSNKKDLNSLPYFDMITKSSDRLQKMINGLLEYSRIGYDLKMSPIDCNVMVREILIDLSTIIEENKTEIICEQLPIVYVHESSVRQLFQNIISNAIKFRKKDINPKLVISAEKLGNEWKFSIQDNGIGMSEENSHQIFDIFHRLHQENEYEGTGIGLAHCKKIIESHHGKIWVDCKPNNGCNFQFTLPEQAG